LTYAGPIVRITPEELHIKDPEYFDKLYDRRARRDKFEYFNGRFATCSSGLTTSKHELHRMRREALNPMFSRQRILKFQPTIREKLEILCRQIAKYKDTGKPLRLHDAFAALAADVITEYAFGKSYDHLESPDFRENFNEAFHASSQTGPFNIQFPWLIPLMTSLPDQWVIKMQPLFAQILTVRRVCILRATTIGCIAIDARTD
jgi:cytochrome P450